MRVKELWIDSFKNLQDFSISFGSELTTVLIGANGTGKSNLLEALAIIFRDLDLELKNDDSLPFEYVLDYECKGKRISVDANPSRTRTLGVQPPLIGETKPKTRRARLSITVDGRKVSMREFFDNKRTFLPNHVFGYYSGPTNRLAQHFDHHQRIFYKQQIEGEVAPLRPLFFALPVHSQFVLLAYYGFPDTADQEFLERYIGVAGLESVLFVLKKPDWAKASSREGPFWGAKGVPRHFLEDLYQIARAPVKTEERLHLYIGAPAGLRQVAELYQSNREFFKNLETLYIAELISEVRISVRRVGGDAIITFSELSEGEQQLLTVLGLMKFTRDEETLFLLDEPDTHLNPAWKYDFLRLVHPIVGDDTECQILLATHDPIVIGSCLKDQVRVLAFDDGEHTGDIICHEPEKDPRGMGVAALLTSDVYGLRSSLDWVTQQKLDEKRELAAKDQLSDSERQRLQELDEELENLGFAYSFREPLYEDFLRIMAEELEEQPDLQGKVLTKKQQDRREQLIRRVVARVRDSR
jgi:predicted ATPase